MKNLLLPTLALCAAAGIGVANANATANAHQVAAASGVSHGARLHVTKDCSTYTGLADQYCTITSSNVKAIKVGSRVVYLQAASGTTLHSDIVLVVGPGNYALGHVRVNLKTGTGKVTLSGGAGRFTAFHARATVSPLGGATFAWNGRYRVCEYRHQ